MSPYSEIYDFTEQTYLSNGVKAEARDQRGVVHEYTYDAISRLVDDEIDFTDADNRT